VYASRLACGIWSTLTRYSRIGGQESLPGLGAICGPGSDDARRTRRLR